MLWTNDEWHLRNFGEWRKTHLNLNVVYCSCRWVSIPMSYIICRIQDGHVRAHGCTLSVVCDNRNLPHVWEIARFTGGNRTKLPSSRWRRRGRSRREVFACLCFSATTDPSQIYNREKRRHGTPCTKTTDSYLFSFLYNNPRKIRRETTVGKFVPNNGRR